MDDATRRVRIQRARAVAAQRGLHEERCRGCGGTGVIRDPNASAPGGADPPETDGNCAGYGFVWYEGPTSTILHRFTVDDLIGPPPASGKP